MASTKEYRDFIYERLSPIGEISFRPMMGEYLVYFGGIYFATICDDRFMVKITEANKKYDMEEVLPYDGAKPMFLVTELDNDELLKEIVFDTVNFLPKKKKK